MQPVYTREVNHCFMSFQSSGSFDETSYELKMIAANSIPALLPVTYSHIDQSVVCQYDISSLQPFSVFCTSHRIHTEELSRLIGNLLDSLLLMEDYLLTGDHLLLDPECLYLKWSTLEPQIAYIPFYTCSLKTSLETLMEYLLSCLGNEDQDTVVLAYRIYHELKEPNLEIGSIRKLLLPDPETAPQPSVASNAASLKRISFASEHTDTEFPDRGRDIMCSDPSFDGQGTSPSAPSFPEPFPPDGTRKKRLRKFLPEKETWKTVLIGVPAAVLIYAVLHICSLGYVSPGKAAGGILLILAALILLLWLLHRRHQTDPVPDSDSFPGFPDPPAVSDTLRLQDSDSVVSANISDEKRQTASASSPLFAPFPEEEQTVLLHSPETASSDTVRQLLPEDREHHAGLSVISLDQDNLLLGFQSDVCDKVIPDPTVSRIHARIQKRGSLFYLSDLSSRNGTFVNDRQLAVHEEVPLEHGMHIRFGGAAFSVK